MILTTMDSAARYEALHPRMAAALRYLRSLDAQTAAPGEYEIDGRALYALVQEYDTMPEDHPGWEGHRRYMDIHCMQYGFEKHLWTEDKAIQHSLPYDEALDLIHPQPASWSALSLTEGQIAIYFPEYLHKAKCMLGSSVRVRKLLIKVLL